MELKIHFGALASPISEQIRNQLNYTDDNIKHFDKDADALVRVHGRGIITDNDVRLGRIRLNKTITKYLQKRIDEF